MNSDSFDRPGLAVRMIAWLALAYLVLPSLIIVPMSFGEGEFLRFPPLGFSLHLYEEFLTTSSWMESTLLSLRVGAISTAIGLLLGTAGAYGLARLRATARGVLMTVVLLPMFVPGIVMALAFYIYFALIGLAGSELALILAHTVLIIPYVVIVMGAALRDVDPALERAARSMGASPLYTFIHVTLPLVKGGIAAAAIFGFLISFDELVVAQFLADIDTRTLPVKMYESIRYEISPVLAAISTLMTVIAFGLSALTTRRQTRQTSTADRTTA